MNVNEMKRKKETKQMHICNFFDSAIKELG